MPLLSASPLAKPTPYIMPSGALSHFLTLRGGVNYLIIFFLFFLPYLPPPFLLLIRAAKSLLSRHGVFHVKFFAKNLFANFYGLHFYCIFLAPKYLVLFSPGKVFKEAPSPLFVRNLPFPARFC